MHNVIDFQKAKIQLGEKKIKEASKKREPYSQVSEAVRGVVDLLMALLIELPDDTI